MSAGFMLSLGMLKKQEIVFFPEAPDQHPGVSEFHRP
jgi:hypothetical protein